MLIDETQNTKQIQKHNKNQKIIKLHIKQQTKMKENINNNNTEHDVT